MPSRNTYSYLPLNGTSPRLMNVDIKQEKSDILLAIHLCRITNRALELNVFKSLQKKINDLPKGEFSHSDLGALGQHLVQLLCTLRWRISWWAVFGVSSSNDKVSADTYTERVTMLTKSLYFWYMVVRTKLPSWERPVPRGAYNFYADATQEVYDDYPEDETEHGFHVWMDRGRSLVRNANEIPFPQSFSHC